MIRGSSLLPQQAINSKLFEELLACLNLSLKGVFSGFTNRYVARQQLEGLGLGRGEIVSVWGKQPPTTRAPQENRGYNHLFPSSRSGHAN